MKSIILIIFIFFTYVGGEIIYSSDDFSKNQERTIYDVNRFVRDTTKCIASAKMLEGKKEFFINNNVHNDIKLLNFFNLIPALINSISNVTNSTCSADLSYIKDNVDFKNYQDSWAIKMLDSFGKPESGILEGNLKWLGNFDECRSVYAQKENDRGGFHGQYCTMQVTVAEYLPISIAVCLPDTCKPSEFVDIFNNSSFIPALNKTGIGFNVTALTCKAKSLELSTGGIVTLCIMSVFFLLVFLGSSVTAFKYFAHSNTSKDECKSPEGKVSEYFVDRSLEEPLVINEGSPTKLKVFIDMCDPVLNCFCVFTNGSKLFNTDSTEGQLLCLHGIRFLSMTWVIVCHVYMSPIAQIRSMKSLLPLIDNLPFQAILNGWYSVDSFFVLSGFLMSYLYFQECAKKQGKTPWLYFYVHRYLRLTPVYMIVLAFYATVMPIMGSGPFWQDNNVDPNCQKKWWWNLIYINNFQNQSEQCMGWSWYLANDMQFFAISPLFLITLWRWPKVGYSMLLLFLWGSWLSGFLITYHYDLIAGTLSYVADIDQAATFTLRWTDYMNKIYVKPYTRIAPYLIGIGLGYILFKRKVTDAKVNRVTLWIGWLLAIPVGLYCVYGLYHQTPNLVAASFYNALTRTGYGLSLSWLIFVCLSGQGGVVDKILSYKLFIPLSRLTYCAYLIHLIVVFLYISSLKTTIVFTHQTIVLMFLGLLIVTYALSVLVSLTFESPIIRLEKLIRSKFQNR